MVCGYDRLCLFVYNFVRKRREVSEHDSWATVVTDIIDFI